MCHVCICSMCLFGACGCQKSVFDPLDLELQVVICYHVGAGE